MNKFKKNKALVIGIDTYTHYNNLNSAVNDAKEIGKALQTLRFDVELCLDESKEIIDCYIENFEEALSEKNYDTALFFFAGHGCIANRSDCLLLKEAPELNCNNEVRVRNKSIVLDSLCQRLRSAGNQINIFIIDACRSECIRSTASNFDFGKNIHIPYQTFIAYSTSPGATAQDGKRHSPYAQSLLKHIQTEVLPIEGLFKQIRKEVYETANQLPWEHSCHIEDFCFNYGQNNPSFELPYSFEALADKNYISSIASAKKIIELFKTYSFYEQEEALRIFKESHKNLSNNDKFVIGRNILQSATGNCFKCIDELKYAPLRTYQTDDTNSVLDGILYEIYFNSDNIFRDKQLKGSEFINQISRLASQEVFKSSIHFIQKALSPYKENLYYIPGNTKIHSIRIEIEYSAPLDDNTIWKVEKISFDNNDITSLLSHNSQQYDKQEFMEMLSHHLCTPIANLKCSFSKEIKKGDYLVLLASSFATLL